MDNINHKTLSNNKPNGRVISYTGNHITVEVSEYSACSGCSQKQGCAHRKVQEYFGSDRTLLIKTNTQFRDGELVHLDIDESYLMEGTFYLYCIPLLFLFIGGTLSSLLLANELTIFIISILSMSIGFSVAKKLASKKEQRIIEGIRITKTFEKN